ncbi:Transthyretin-like family-containing protein [Aphelenchoides fujianensis]|nr:Transthyretin-like family-containing protein [Aphelenchoides fujianensis]
MRSVQLFALGLLLLAGTSMAMRKQGAAVKGQLLCNGLPEKNVKVKLMEVDRNPGDSDDLLDEKFTDARGYFLLDGTTRELTTIEPELRIFTDCEDGIKPCKRRIVIPVPSEYIHHGTAEKVFDIGSKDLAPQVEGEGRTCTDE